MDFLLPQIMEDMMEVVLFIPCTRQNRTVEQIVDSGGNLRVGVMRHAFHLAQILRAQATRSHVSSRSVVANYRRFQLFSDFVWIFPARKSSKLPC